MYSRRQSTSGLLYWLTILSVKYLSLISCVMWCLSLQDFLLSTFFSLWKGSYLLTLILLFDHINRLRSFKSLLGHNFHNLQNIWIFCLKTPAFLQLKDVDSRELCIILLQRVAEDCAMCKALCWLSTFHLHTKDNINVFCHRKYVMLAPNSPQTP